MKKLVIFLLICAPIVALLSFSITRNPRDLKTTLTGRPAPDFSLQTLDGKNISLQELKGRPVVLNFWATWCPTCLQEHQVIKQAVQMYGPLGIQFISVLYEDSAEKAKSFLEEYGKACEVLLDPDLRTAIDYGISGVPETFFIDARGTVVEKFSGPLSPYVVEEKINLLMK